MPIGGGGLFVFGHPPDDPTLDLHAILYTPTDLVTYPPPWPCVCGSRAGGFNMGGFTQTDPIFKELSGLGFLCMAFEVRLMKGGNTDDRGLPGQTTDGRYNVQVADEIMGLRYLRSQANCSGWVAALGGSGSAHHAWWLALAGTAGDDRSDASVLLSPVTDYSDRAVDVQPYFVATVVDYNRGETDLGILHDRSPVAVVSAAAAPVLHFNGDAEDMPLTQLQLSTAAYAALNGGAGVPIEQYQPVTNTGSLGKHHAFAMWNPNDGSGGVHLQVIAWLQARYADWVNGGGTGGPPPPPPPPPTRELITANITGLTPATFYTLKVAAKDKITGLTGEFVSFDFVSDRSATGGTQKDAPEGNFVLVPAPGGIPPDLSTRPWLDFAYVDGARLPTQMNVVNPNLATYDWSVITTFLDLLDTHGKLGGISIAAGLFTPAWVYRRGAVGITLSGGGTMPLPWDATYIGIMKNMIKAFATQFGAHNALSYVVFTGFMQNVSCFLTGSEDYNALNAAAVAAGYADVTAGFTFAAQTLIGYWAKALPTIHCVLDLGFPVPDTLGGLDAMSSLLSWADQTMGNKFAVMADTLTGATTNDAGIDGLVANERVQTGYQFAFPASNPSCDPDQDPLSYDAELGLRDAANAGIAQGAAFEEFIESDILITTAPYPADFGTFQTGLKANSHN